MSIRIMDNMHIRIRIRIRTSCRMRDTSLGAVVVVAGAQQAAPVQVEEREG